MAARHAPLENSIEVGTGIGRAVEIRSLNSDQGLLRKCGGGTKYDQEKKADKSHDVLLACREQVEAILRNLAAKCEAGDSRPWFPRLRSPFRGSTLARNVLSGFGQIAASARQLAGTLICTRPAPEFAGLRHAWMNETSRLSISVACRQSTGCSRIRRRNSSRGTSSTSALVTARAVRLYGLPVKVAGKPSTEPAGNTRSNRGKPSTRRQIFPRRTRYTPTF